MRILKTVHVPNHRAQVGYTRGSLVVDGPEGRRQQDPHRHRRWNRSSSGVLCERSWMVTQFRQHKDATMTGLWRPTVDTQESTV